MFVTVDRQRKPSLPWATLAIVAACAALFFWLVLAPERWRFMREWGTVPTRLFDANTPLLQQFVELRWLRPFTGLFIHLGWLHLVGNLLFLMIFGVPAERALGPWRFLLLFLIGGALANLAEAVMLPLPDAGRPIVGSSGAVSAIIGAYLSLFPRARLGLVLPLGMFLEFVRIPAPLLIGFWFLLQIAFTFVGPALGAVAWWAHIAGFAAGLLFALVSKAAIKRRLRS